MFHMVDFTIDAQPRCVGASGGAWPGGWAGRLARGRVERAAWEMTAGSGPPVEPWQSVGMPRPAAASDRSHPFATSFATKAVHGGNGVDAETGAIRRPIVMANSYALPDDPSSINWSSTDTLLYTRNSGANQLYLQEKLAALELRVYKSVSVLDQLIADGSSG